MLETVLDILSWILLSVGGIFVFAGGLGALAHLFGQKRRGDIDVLDRETKDRVAYATSDE